MDETKNGVARKNEATAPREQPPFRMPRRGGRELTWDEFFELKSSFDQNRAEFPPAELVRYRGQIVAWEPDGSAIRAAAPDLGALYARIRAEGDDTSLYTYEDIPEI